MSVDTHMPSGLRTHLRKWIGRGFMAWGGLVFVYLFSGYRTVGVDRAMLEGDAVISVSDGSGVLSFTPQNYAAGLIFFCGSGVSASAYAPMLRPVAAEGVAVFVVKLPFRFALLESHRQRAVGRAMALIEEHREVSRWIVAGHSLGGALSCRIARDRPDSIDGLVLIGTTHPKVADLSRLEIPVTKIYASNDGVAPAHKVEGNMRLLPASARYVLIEGGNHCQFGHYARQFLDGRATIGREEQQAIARDAILELMAVVRQGRTAVGGDFYFSQAR